MYEYFQQVARKFPSATKSSHKELTATVSEVVAESRPSVPETNHLKGGMQKEGADLTLNTLSALSDAIMKGMDDIKGIDDTLSVKK